MSILNNPPSQKVDYLVRLLNPVKSTIRDIPLVLMPDLLIVKAVLHIGKLEGVTMVLLFF